MSRADLSTRPSVFGRLALAPRGAIRNVPSDTVIDTSEPLHEQLGSGDPDHDSLRDWFVDRTPEPLDEGPGTPLVGLRNAYAYRYVHPEITSHFLLSVRASGDPELAARFGMDPDDVLDQSQLARAYGKRFDRQGRQDVQFRAAKLAVEAAKAGFEVNHDAAHLVAHHLPEAQCHYAGIDPIVDEDDTVEVPEGQKARAGEEVKEFLTDLDLSRPDKGTIYEDDEIVEVWRRASIDNVFAEGMADTYDEHDTSADYQAPCGETLRKPIRDLDIPDEQLAGGDIEKAVVSHEDAVERARAEEWSERFDAINWELLEEAQSYGMFDRGVTICVDGTSIPHRNQNRPDAPDSCIKNRSSDESVWCYEHITISAVDCRRSFKLGSLLLRDHGKQSETVAALLREAEKRVNINWVLWDGGFDAGALISYCNARNLRFVGRKKRQGNVVEDTVEETANEEGTTALNRGYEYTTGARCDLFAVQRGEINLENISSDSHSQTELGEFSEDGRDADDDEEWILWATNSDTLTEENIMAHGMLYRVRWSIETSYRVIKEKFKAKTTSVSDAIRIFVWKLGMILYNAWVLLRILIREKGITVRAGDTVVKTHAFQRVLETEYG